MLDKGYVIVEKIPNNCKMCNFFMGADNYTTSACLANGFTLIEDRNKKPEWCPIKEFPKEDDENYFPDEFLDGMATGWNMCLKKIKGEEMNF